ncbi:MAG: hypothetical protein M1837_005798 [Sclerophora amabilis]|nr:MAG: hypothetical protein M1837_005798 [Sclerophora amabilis]
MSLAPAEMSESSDSSQRPSRPTSKFVRTMRKVYRPLGFAKGYNFPLFVIFAGALMGFVLARFSYLNVSGDAPSSFASGGAPGEWYHYRNGHYRIGITMHLAACLPAGFLVVWQFVPVIRHKFLLFHRINGYLVIVLTLISNVGALMICRRSFGGGLDTQSAVGTLAILTTASIGMAYYNIKRLQIDQHRAWMLRMVFYLGTIITTRIIMILSALIISMIGSYYHAQSCDQIVFVNDGDAGKVESVYPGCANRTASSDPYVVVSANLAGGRAEEAGASLDLSFGSAIWLAIFLHVVGVEIYLNLTPAETDRLRNVSYERQLEAGYEHPGSAGLTADRWGDAPEWKPASQPAIQHVEHAPLKDGSRR